MDNPGEILRLCRLCLVKDQVNIPIFEEQGDIRQTFLKIRSCLPVKVSRDDKLPKKICGGCSNKLDLFYEFWSSTANSEKTLQSWLGQEEEDDKMQEITKPVEALVKEESEALEDGHAHDQSFDEATKDEAEAPPAKRARRTAAVKAQINISHDSDEDEDVDGAEPITKIEDESDDSDGEEKDPSYTEVPGTSADDQAGPSGLGKDGVEAPFKQRKRRRKPSSPELAELKMEIKLEDPLTLDETKPKLKKGRKKGSKNRPLPLRKPKKNRTAHPPPIELDEPIECDVCNETYKNNVAFALHSIEHSKDRRFSCHLCDFKNTSKYHIEMHVRAHEGTTKYKCEICNKAFTVSTNAHEHKYFHTGEKPFRCEICGKHFMYSRFLASHRRTQHYEIITGTPLVKYDCKICNKHYTSSSGLRRHNLRNHNTEGIDTTVLCDTCGKRISSKEKLKFHMRIHTGYKPFSCEVCGKAFSEKERLKEHMRVHTGEKPFMCKFCGKAFTQRSPLKIHERTHTGEQPYICRLCGRGHVSKSSMDAHMKSCSALQIPSSNPGPQHLQEPYTCNIGMCNKIFGSKAALEGHLPCHVFPSYDIFDDKDEGMQEVLERKQFTASLNELAGRRDFSNNMVFGKQEGLGGEAQDFTQKRVVRGEAYEQGVGQL
ncbi:zinc finger protein 271-like isoform X8 [Euwallacea similis]|uniref:zinc finger protein 271-like isoform X8 n=1 Tax=Euwallacea similis TaxID=1736056 RepID=UPI00344C3415